VSVPASRDVFTPGYFMPVNTLKTPYRILLDHIHGCVVPVVVRVPGRVNLIGEHTDYNGGLAMPAAINRYLYISVSKSDDDDLHLYADGFDNFHTELSSLYPQPGAWHTYVQGVAAGLIGQGYNLGGFILHVCGDIPTGAGLSSSAALCCGATLALAALFKLDIKKEAIAVIAQQAEQVFAGVNCGLMDQYACLFGKRGYAMKLDFSTLKFEYVRLNLETLDLVLFDTGVKHNLATTEYNQRRTECATALDKVKGVFPQVKSLREVTMDMLRDAVLITAPVPFKRARFFLEENKRVETVAVALERRMLSLVGGVLYESHQGLSGLYHVSCPELDLLIALAKAEKAVAGARMMGGGFGGSTINLVEKNTPYALQHISETYQKETGIKLKNYRFLTADGARVLDNREIRNIRLDM